MEDNTPTSSASRVRAARVENTFPTPLRGITPEPSLRINGRSSPAPTKLLRIQRAQSTPPELTNYNPFRRTSHDNKGYLPDTSSLEQSWLLSSKQLVEYHDSQFPDPRHPFTTKDRARERFVRDSVIVVEVKLNHCVRFPPRIHLKLTQNSSTESTIS